MNNDARRPPLGDVQLEAIERKLEATGDSALVGGISYRLDVRDLLAEVRRLRQENAAFAAEIERRASENAALQDRTLATGHALLAVANHVAKLSGGGDE